MASTDDFGAYRMGGMSETYDTWLDQVRGALRSINMRIEDWQVEWPFDFPGEYTTGTKPDDAALKANRYWWQQQNKSLGRDCRKTPSCWLPEGHQGECQPTYEPGDYVKAEFPDEATGIGEWMWVRVDYRDDEKRLVVGTLDNEPVNDYDSKLQLGAQLAVSYDNIREHRRRAELSFKVSTTPKLPPTS